MTDVEYHRSRYDTPKAKGLFGVPPGVLLISLLIVSLLFAALAFYFINAQFKLRQVNYSDDAVDVEIIEPIPPPPVTLPIEPTKKEDRVEYTGPPVIVPGPPPPPAPPAPPRPSVITNPTWARQPQVEFPERAMSRGIEGGRVTLNCLVQPNGSMTDCNVVSEDPAGAGFAQAAQAAARRARLSPRTVDGAATGARVTFTTRFVPPAD
ncbi:MAG: TonB family protein [Brevundimonas sp.]|nr:MAG: TonB family protein [Brevundimonas sp.]